MLIPTSIIREETGIYERMQSQILVSKQIRNLYNILDSGPDPRNRKQAFRYSDISAIADYLDDPIIPLDNKRKP
jgi:hypothetical protein